MKKIYRSPQTEIVLMRTTGLIAMSQEFNEQAGKEGTVLSREDYFWDDED